MQIVQEESMHVKDLRKRIIHIFQRGIKMVQPTHFYNLG